MPLNVKFIKQAADKFSECRPLFFALGEETRQKIVMMLAESGEKGMNVSDITTRLHLSRPAISHHLKILKTADILKMHKQGTQRFYKLSMEKPLSLSRDLQNIISVVLESVNSSATE